MHLGGWRIWGVALCTCLVGCERATEQRFVVAPEFENLDESLQSAVSAELQRRCGTPRATILLGADEGRQARLVRGAELYRYYCQQCHGVTGDGNGLAAPFLDPKPRDYRKGIFKFTSTGYGNKPRVDDLIETVRRGVTGTSMPSFDRFSQRDLEAVVDYVLALTHRGELETLLIAQADSEGELTPEAAEELTQLVLDQWREANGQVVDPITKMLEFNEESVAAGQEIFQKRECFKCHGRDGRGGLAAGIEVGQDAWGNKAAAADLTSGMLRGGARPIDIYRRIYAGINGTPMPAFRDVLAEDPDDIWRLAHYVMFLSDQRRRGVMIPPAGQAVAQTETSKQEAQTPSEGGSGLPGSEQDTETSDSTSQSGEESQ